MFTRVRRMNEQITEPSRKVPILMRVDVAVAGGGPAGWTAAIAAARNGARTVLVERYGFLYGMGTNGYVAYFPCKELAPKVLEEKPLCCGVVQELLKRCEAMGGAVDPFDSVRYKVLKGFESHSPFDPEVMKVACIQMAKESGVELLLHTLVVGAVREGNTVKGVTVESKSGRQAILADVVVDATGDGDVAAFAGAEFEQDPPEKALGTTLIFRVANVDMDKAKKHTVEDLGCLAEEAVRKGELPEPEPGLVIPGWSAYDVRFLYVDLPPGLGERYIRRNEVFVTASLPGVNVVDVEDLSRAEQVTRKRTFQVTNFLRKYVHGFQEAYLSSTAVHIGIRESRRILGGYVLKGEDVEKGSRFADVIARGTAYEQNLGTPGPGTFGPGPAFDIPYRCRCPLEIDGRLTSGRCISIDSGAAKFLSPREIATCHATGQAAGTAAALCVKNGTTPRALDVGLLQRTLREQDANLGP